MKSMLLVAQLLSDTSVTLHALSNEISTVKTFYPISSKLGQKQLTIYHNCFVLSSTYSGLIFLHIQFYKANRTQIDVLRRKVTYADQEFYSRQPQGVSNNKGTKQHASYSFITYMQAGKATTYINVQIKLNPIVTWQFS